MEWWVLPSSPTSIPECVTASFAFALVDVVQALLVVGLGHAEHRELAPPRLDAGEGQRARSRRPRCARRCRPGRSSSGLRLEELVRLRRDREVAVEDGHRHAVGTAAAERAPRSASAAPNALRLSVCVSGGVRPRLAAPRRRRPPRPGDAGGRACQSGAGFFRSAIQWSRSSVTPRIASASRHLSTGERGPVPLEPLLLHEGDAFRHDRVRQATSVGLLGAQGRAHGAVKRPHVVAVDLDDPPAVRLPVGDDVLLHDVLVDPGELLVVPVEDADEVRQAVAARRIGVPPRAGPSAARRLPSRRTRARRVRGARRQADPFHVLAGSSPPARSPRQPRSPARGCPCPSRCPARPVRRVPRTASRRDETQERKRGSKYPSRASAA